MQEINELVSENDTSFREVLNKYFMQNIDEICGALTQTFKVYLKSQPSDVFLFLLFPKFKQEQVQSSDQYKIIREHVLSGNFPSLRQTRKQQQQEETRKKKYRRTRKPDSRGKSEPRAPFESFTHDPRGQSEFRRPFETPLQVVPHVNEEPSWEDRDIEPLKSHLKK